MKLDMIVLAITFAALVTAWRYAIQQRNKMKDLQRRANREMERLKRIDNQHF
jgi:hypothetical protein